MARSAIPPSIPVDPMLNKATESRQSQTGSQQIECRLPESQQTNDAGKKWLASYTENEDVQLCQLLIIISEDPIVGTNQDGATFWRRFEQTFKSDNNASFKNLQCYNILIKCPKWCTYIDENSKKNQDSTTKKKQAERPSSNTPATTASTSNAVSDFKENATDHSSLGRPFGNKKAKRLHHIKNDIFDKEAQSLQMMAMNGAANNDVMIMNQDISNLDDDAREYFTLRQKQILASLQANASSSS
ncbi:hypothetical protein PGT21_012381 [Puccinia graminis f. sp. tritici]|uniref:No apical meristem-associated C-terminal domain-containing protein n=1 Tax=Puccinia graminis f. sp. tritici TaxID=56615 RepID=A0A5B0PR35_PUCGR|nr:hypothetical protein PGT21_012381 [Puccinia graminis f. sp. tritici]